MAAGSTAYNVQKQAIGLPVPLTRLFGRDLEVTRISELLLDDATRLITLLGPGGSGKTRLAIAVAHDAANVGASVAFVDLTTVRASEALLPAVASALKLSEGVGEIIDSLAAAFADEALLLVLDNLEQIPDAETPVSMLLERFPALTVLSTSRRSLGVAGEQLWPVDPLRLPERNDVASISASAAADFFVACARRVRPGFAVTSSTASVIADIVRQLDGLPLAIELAAARLRTLTLDALLIRLRQPLSLLTGGSRARPERQQTMRATIAWSVDLLVPADRDLYASLGVFRGGFSLEAATSIATDLGTEMLDRITSLVDQCLIRNIETTSSESRYAMLETIREDALERLRASHDAEHIRFRHAAFFTQLAEELAPLLLDVDQVNALDRLERDLANFEAALDWCIDQGDGLGALRIAGAIWRFWFDRGSPSEGRRWLEQILQTTADIDHPLHRAQALNGLGALCLAQADYPAASAAFGDAVIAWERAGDVCGLGKSLSNLALIEVRLGRPGSAQQGFEQALNCFRQVGDETRIAIALDNLGYASQELGDFAQAKAFHQEALALHEKLGNLQGISAALHNLGVAASALGDDVAASRFHRRELPIARELGNRGMEALALNSLGYLASARNGFAEAHEQYEQALEMWRDLGDEHGVALALHNLAADAIKQKDLKRALPLLRESLTIRARLDSPNDLGLSLNAVSEIADQTGSSFEAIRLVGASSRLRAAPKPEELDDIRARLGDAAFSTAWEEGTALSRDQAVGIALMVLTATGTGGAIAPDLPPPVRLHPAPVADDHGLTAREIEVLRLIAAGRSNAEIGEALFISPFTAKTHVSNLLAKLGADTRAAAATWAARQGIA